MPPLYSPTGSLIVGTKEMIPGIARMSGATRAPDGKIVPEYSGGTDALWENQVTDTLDDQKLFVDDDGEEWQESQVTFEEPKEEETEECLGGKS